MRDILARTSRLAMVAGAALLATACGGGGDAPNEADANAVDANMMLDQPANDASAMESAVNAIETSPYTVPGNQDEANDVLGETEGGDTGGNTVESNVSGM